MSQFLSGGGVECGPSNALKTVSTRLERDASIRQDRLISVPSTAGPSNQAFKPVSSRPDTAAPSSVQTPFDLSSLRQHLSPTPIPQQRPLIPSQPQISERSTWVDHFNPQRVERRVAANSSQNGTTAGPWQEDFHRQLSLPSALILHGDHRPPQHIFQNEQAPLAPWQRARPNYAPVLSGKPFTHIVPAYQSLPHTPLQYPSPPGQQQAQHRPASTPTEKTFTAEHHEPLTDSQDLLAKTARDFVETLHSSDNITAANPKLAQSKFMALMNGLSQGRVVVEEGAAPQNAEDVGPGARMVDKSKGMDWTEGFLDLEAEGSTSIGTRMAEESARSDYASVVGQQPDLQSQHLNEVHVPHTAMYQHFQNMPMHSTYYDSLQDSRSRTQTPLEPSLQDSAWEQQFKTQDALIMADRPSSESKIQRPSARSRRKSVHFDQTTEVQELGSGMPHQVEEALRQGATAVPGARGASDWEERMEDDVDVVDVDSDIGIDEDAFMEFNGTVRQAHDSRIGIGDLEGWGGLQKDWEEFQKANQAGQRGLRGIRQGDGVDRYLLQRKNPYTDGMEQVSRTEGLVLSPGVGVLELEAEVQHDPTNHEAWYHLGLKQQENEREDQAILALSKTIQLSPEYRPAYLALAVSYTNEGEFEGANTMLERWIDLGEGAIEGGAMQGDVRSGRNGWEEGQRKLVDRLIDLARRDPEVVDPDVQVALGVLFNSSEEYHKAEDCFMAALSVRPDDWLLYNRLGATLANSGRSNQAIEYYHRALSLHPTFVRALFNLGISYINLSQYKLAAQNILEALRLQYSDATEAYNSGDLEGIGKSMARGVMSETLWNSLRNACLHMNRQDLVDLATRKDISGFPMDLTTD